MRALTTALLVALAAPASAQIFDDASVGFPPGTLPFGQLDWMMPTPAGGFTALSAPFTSTGCKVSPYTTGTAVITLVRATNQSSEDLTLDCASGELVVGFSGVEVWKAAPQLYPTPSAPAAGSATATATGNHTFSVVGTGSQQISAGTATTTGLPCTATEASPCVFGVTVAGTLTLSAVTGSLTYGQIEVGAYRTPQILAFPYTRNAGVVTTPLPDLGNKWCVSVTAKPGSGQVWTSGSGYLLLGGTSGAANSFYVTRNFFEVRDSAGGQKYVGTFGASVPSTGGRLTACNNAGTLTMCANGAVIASTPTGAGTALWSSTPATLTIGSSAGSTVFDGALSNLKVCRFSGPATCGGCR